jgi:broad specificity phosphatase PhoE
MDTDVGPWSGKKPDELRDDPAWKTFVEHPSEAPAGVESLAVVQARAMSVVQEVLARPELGSCVVLVTHGDVVKLILAHYLGIRIECVRYLAIGNASISALAFIGEGAPEVVAINWSPSPGWLAAEPAPSALPAPSAEAANSLARESPSEAAPERAPKSAEPS